jgi:hypothetical protein
VAHNRKIPDVKQLKLTRHEQQQQDVLDYIANHGGADMNHQLVNAARDVLVEVIGKQSELEEQELNHLAQTCSRFRTLFKPMVNIKKLLQRIAYGEQEAAEKMIDADPRLLMMSGDVVDYSHRKIIDVTPVQLAFGGDDEVMCAMLKEKMCAYSETTHQNREWGETIFSNQIRAKFPEDAEAEQKAAAEFDEFMEQLVAAINDPHANIDELNHEPNESPLRKLLDGFRVKFAPGEVRAGKHFNVQLLLKALEIYDTNYEIWDTDQRILLWSQVVGYLERLLPVSYVQAVCQGIDNVRKGKPLKRVLTLCDNTSYYPLDAEPANRLGFNHGVNFDANARMSRRYEWRGNSMSGALWFAALKSSKHLKLAELIRPHREEKLVKSDLRLD